MVNYDVINATDTALATGGSTAAAQGMQLVVALTDANLATLAGLENVAVIKTGASQLNRRNIADVLLRNAMDERKGRRRW
jgi:hypothetical protein